ncbi:MAG: Ig-like domain-containing protein [Nitrososphaerales archaeon]
MKTPTTLFLALTLISTLLLAAPAYAQLTITLNKETYYPGEFLSLTGSGAPANQPVSIQVVDPAGEIKSVAQVQADSAGAFTATNFYRLPAAPTGTWTVKAKVAGLTATDTFTLLAADTTPPTITSVSLDKTIVKGGASITVTVEATDNVGVASVKADTVSLTLEAGKWVGSITASTTEGVHTVTVVATDIGGNTATSTTSYRVDNTPPTITHTPITTAAINTSVEISATITDNVNVKEATLNYRVVGAAEYTVVAMSAVGNTYTATIPATAVTAKGVEYYISASDTAGNTARAPAAGAYIINVMVATLTLTPNHAAPEAKASFSGSNFTPAKTYTLTLNWSGLTITLASGTVSAAGTISGTFTVPAIQSQVYEIVAKDEAGITATARFGVEQVSTAALASKVDALSTQLTNVEKTLSTKMDTAQTAITSAISSAQTAITGAISSAQSDIKAAISSAQTTITAAISSAQKAATDAVSAAQSDIKAAISSAQTAITGAISSAQSDIKAAISSAQTTVTNAVNDVSKTINTAQSTLAGSIKGVDDSIKSAQNTLSASISTVKSDVDSLAKEVGSISAGVSSSSTFVLVVTALAVIILVLELAVLIRRR